MTMKKTFRPQSWPEGLNQMNRIPENVNAIMQHPIEITSKAIYLKNAIYEVRSQKKAMKEGMMRFENLN